MRRRRKAALAVMRKVLTCAICAIAFLGLLSVHVHVSPFVRHRKLPTLGRLRTERSVLATTFHDLPFLYFHNQPFALISLSRFLVRLMFGEIRYDRSIAEKSWTRKLSRPELPLAPPTFKAKNEIQYQSLTTGHTEHRWTQELVPPHLSKIPISSPELNVTSRRPNFNKLWKSPSNRNFGPCVDPGPDYTPPLESKGYLLVHTNGGLNQMRAGICDMVAISRIINATLVIPELDKRSFWQDTSNFSDIFDEDHFIFALSNDVKVVKKLPKDNFRMTKVIRAAKSDSRLANNNLPPDIQKLRCRACYEALRFSPKIEAMGKLLVDRMRSYGPYIALHLRFEKDMLAFSGCNHGLSSSEAAELRTIRENTAYWKVKDIDGREQRLKGYCPLTPKEVGIFLAALGYPSNTPIYVAAGEIYGGESRIADLRSRFSMLMSKDTLASSEELEPFINHASQMAALDYIVSVESDVFIPSYSGNMARAVEGHRRYLGHRKTISPDRKALVRLIDKIEQGALKEGSKISNRIIEIHKTRQGSPRRRKGPISGAKGMDRLRSEEPFYENPLPDCLCQRGSLTRNSSAVTR